VSVWWNLRNFAVKFSILSARVTGEERPNPQAFLDLSPEEMLKKYQATLGDTNTGIVMFAFSDKALLDILDEEFEMDMDRNVLMFRKTFLDANSIRLAGGGRASCELDSFTHAESRLINDLALWLLDATRSLYRGDLNEVRIEDIKQEYAENFRVYARKCVPEYEPGDAESLLKQLFASLKSMMTFTHSLTVDAMFKADAAKVIFGEQSGYYQAWFRKQIFRHMMSKAVEQYITACIVD
jgi:hypothetical protein